MINISKKLNEFENQSTPDLNNNIVPPTLPSPKNHKQQQQQQQKPKQQPKRNAEMTVNSAENGHATTVKVGKEAVAGLANEKALLELMERTGYPITQNNGQRKFGPPPNMTGVAPSRGCEVFVGKLPRDCYEDELVPVFEKAGKIYELRLMMDYNGQNRGYAFVVYCAKRDAQKCVRTINNYEIRKGRLLGVCQSVDNCRLFIGGIPKKVKKEEILEEISKVTDNVIDVIVYPSATDKTKNRGFAFVEYDHHRAAAMARRKLMNGKIQLWGHPIAVDWAEPEQEVDEEIMDQVKVLYVRNLQLSTTEETIENLFKKFAEVDRVKKIKDYCFVHFSTRDGARHALEQMQGESIDGADVEVTLAKPVDKEHYRQQRAVAKLMQMANQYPQFPVPPELTQFNGMHPSFNHMPGLVYPPPFLPGGGQVGGVRPIARGRGRTAAGSRSAGGRAYVLNGFLPSLHPLLQASIGGGNNLSQEHMYDILPGMDLSPTNPLTLKPQSSRSPQQLLEEICQKNNWGTPIYTLHSTVTNDGQLFLYKVTIPPLGHTYQPQKLCRSLDEAKHFAAEYTLSQVGTDANNSPQLSPAPYPVRVPAAAMNGRGNNDGGNYPGYVPITTQTPVVPGVVAKVTWPNGVPPPPGTYFEFPDPQEYQQYHRY
ncbi:APOBEC1 complementation factor-like isoform X2 [Hydractinia symbiolongicarpus]|uniref:APOBEC1 complementation factor-like isoform X2 n=1 Tax=Hydractinia symbiolongicarpus TaxID=13093 RepID=UPI002550EDDE|nr:APOBEC1 complementation factor-like isoform X2 [Hydractinia symbiolongicarpus]